MLLAPVPDGCARRPPREKRRAVSHRGRKDRRVSQSDRLLFCFLSVHGALRVRKEEQYHTEAAGTAE